MSYLSGFIYILILQYDIWYRFVEILGGEDVMKVIVKTTK